MSRAASQLATSERLARRHRRDCNKCSPVPTIGPCPAGQRLLDGRTRAALDVLEEAACGIGAVTFNCRNPRGEPIVHFTADPRVVGGIGYRPDDDHPWMASIGLNWPDAPGAHHVASFAARSIGEVADAVPDLVEQARKRAGQAEVAR